MATESPPVALQKPRTERAEDRPAAPSGRASGPLKGILADVGLAGLFLALTFLLGAFPLKDADIYWHLRTGQLIRQTGEVPRTDIFTYTREGRPGPTCTGSSRSRSAGCSNAAGPSRSTWPNAP